MYFALRLRATHKHPIRLPYVIHGYQTQSSRATNVVPTHITLFLNKNEYYANEFLTHIDLSMFT